MRIARRLSSFVARLGASLQARLGASRRAALVAMGIALACGLTLGFLLWPGPDAQPDAPADAARLDDTGKPLLTPPPLPSVPVAERSGQGSITLPGDVVDVAGQPVPNAAVTAELELGPGLTVVPAGLSTTPAVVAATDGNGAFTLVGLEPGRYQGVKSLNPNKAVGVYLWAFAIATEPVNVICH